MADQSKTYAGGSSDRSREVTTGPISACSRCRKQKLKCSRDQPACRRCQNLRIACYYPPPPDRKLLASLRTTSSKKRLRESSEIQEQQNQQQSSSSSTTTVDQRQSPASNLGSLHDTIRIPSPTDVGGPRWPYSGNANEQSRSQQSLQSQNPAAFSSLTRSFLTNIPQGCQPTEEEGLILIDIYFARIYFAPILINKRILVADYLAKRATPSVMLSIFALASIFLLDNPEVPPISEAARLSNYRELGLLGNEWAETANTLVLQKADQPTMETVQASQNLGLYWFSRNQVRRTDMHSHIGYRSCRLLGYNRLTSVDKELGAVETERRRRCFWSLWGMSCISQEHANFRGRPWVEVAGLPLVSDEASYFAGNPISRKCFDQEGNVQDIVNEGGIAKKMDSSLVVTNTPSFSLYAEIAKLLGLWWEIHMFTKSLTSGATEKTVDHIPLLYKLDQRLTIAMNGLPEELECPPGFRFSNYTHDPHKFFGLHSLHYQSRCILHSSIVPIFSGNENPNPERCIPDDLVRLSARTAIKYSSEYIDLAMDYLSINPDISQCWGFIGFSVFVCTSIQLTFWNFHGNVLAAKGEWRVFAVLSILRVAKSWWAPLNRLWARLKTVSPHIETHSHPNMIKAAREASESSESNLGGEGVDEKSKIEYNNILESVVAACRSGPKLNTGMSKLRYVPGDLIEHDEEAMRKSGSTSAVDGKPITVTLAHSAYVDSSAPPMQSITAIRDDAPAQRQDTISPLTPTRMSMILNPPLGPSNHSFSHMGGGAIASSMGMPPGFGNFVPFNTDTNPSAHVYSPIGVVDQQMGMGGVLGYNLDPSMGGNWYNQTVPGMEGDYFGPLMGQQVLEQSQGSQPVAGFDQHQPEQQQQQQQREHQHPHPRLQPHRQSSQQQGGSGAGDGGVYQPG